MGNRKKKLGTKKKNICINSKHENKESRRIHPKREKTVRKQWENMKKRKHKDGKRMKRRSEEEISPEEDFFFSQNIFRKGKR